MSMISHFNPNRLLRFSGLLAMFLFTLQPVVSVGAGENDVQPLDSGLFPGTAPDTPIASLWSDMLLDVSPSALTYLETRHGTPAGLSITSNEESFLRPLGHYALTLAIAVKTGVYDESVAGRSSETALNWSASIAAKMALAHNGTGAVWGDQWQSAMWAHRAALTAWLVWDRLDSTGRDAVAAMLEHEANRFLAQPPEYWNGSGGNTHAEENGWNGVLITLAPLMMPDHPNAGAWTEKGVEYHLAATARQADLASGEVINGRSHADWIAGYNYRDNGLVINHNIDAHPGYSVSPLYTGGQSALNFALAGRTIPRALFVNHGITYSTLANFPFPSPPWASPGGTIFRNDGTIYWPDPAGREIERAGRYYVFARVGTLADLIGYYSPSPSGLTAADYESLHANKLRTDQLATGDGSTGEAPEDGDYNPAEGIAYGWFARWLAHRQPLTLHDDPIGPPQARSILPLGESVRIESTDSEVEIHFELTDGTAVASLDEANLIQTAGPATARQRPEGNLHWWLTFPQPGTYTFRLSLDAGGRGTTTLDRTFRIEPTTPYAAPTDGFLYYDFEGSGTTVTDIRGGDHNGILTGDAARSPGGITGSRASFSGNGSVSLPQSDQINTATAGYTEKTVAFAFRATNPAAGRQVIFEQGGTSRGLNAYLDGGRLFLGAWAVEWAAGNHHIDAGPVEAGAWIHAAIVLDAPAGEVRFFRDASRIATRAAALLPRHSNAGALGMRASECLFHDGPADESLSYGFQGNLDNVWMTNTATSETQLLSMALNPPLSFDITADPAPTPLSPFNPVVQVSGANRTLVDFSWEKVSAPGGVSVPENGTGPLLFALPGDHQLTLQARNGLIGLRREIPFTVSGLAGSNAFDQFRTLYFGANYGTLGGPTSASGDFDHDGVNNFFEHLSGTDPTAPGDSQSLRIEREGNGFLLKLRRSRALDLVPAFQSSPDLENWSPPQALEPDLEAISPQFEMMSFPIPAPADDKSMFFRFSQP